ncbi:dihydroorotate dehydrogenase electron transfer subunit [Marvinbryantia formatexigens]|nr:dihydroorotate dehydrogenase electron transfer subunit [Marvinbryantia formatexigens]UWO23537.1 dihydroorotate dehydrogenase electron transfer subunit [Marvinbryantia formatexigens DSM 14469]SDG54907.1 dihydroorotate dehydrogenase electron transfer subunit [Marvinbryantia formatexigens]
MGKVMSNRALGEDFYLMRVEQKNDARMGQFYMLRSWETYPVLSRPISVYDADDESVSFLYKVVGKGTELFARLQAGDEITLDGAHGNGFPSLTDKKRIALVGGGVGIAPLYLAAKTYKKENPECSVDIYLGFSGTPVLTEEFETVCDRLTVNVGGFVTDDIDPTAYDAIVTCGPTVMMKVLYNKCVKCQASAPLYVSMENRMACGIGACLVCSCKTKNGNRKVCKDGPVFSGSEVFGIEQ